MISSNVVAAGVGVAIDVVPQSIASARVVFRWVDGGGFAAEIILERRAGVWVVASWLVGAAGLLDQIEALIQ